MVINKFGDRLYKGLVDTITRHLRVNRTGMSMSDVCIITLAADGPLLMQLLCDHLSSGRCAGYCSNCRGCAG